MNKNMRPPEDGFLPLVIGVVGHRDLRVEDVPKLEQLVGQIIETFQKDLPNTHLILLSALAEGADLVVARVALDRGVRLIAPLPMRRDLYRMDFSSNESATAFDELLLRATNWFELPSLRGASEAEISKNGEARDRQYEQAGAYIVRHSHLLVALWDGINSDAVGGTSQIISFQLEGVPEPYTPISSPIDTPESGPVYHVVTPRMSSSDVDQPFTVRKLFPKGYAGEADRFNRICTRIDTFNRDIIKRAKLLSRNATKTTDEIFPRATLKELSVHQQFILQRFSLADTLAICFQNRTRWALNLLFISVLLVAITFDLYSHFFPERHWILTLYLGLLAGAYFLNLWVQKRDYQNKHQDYRALAEGMRVQFYWRLAGLELSVADHYLRKQRSELDWICSAIRVWNIPEVSEDSETENPETFDQDRRLNLVLKHWVEDQSNFFVRAAKRDHDKLKRWEPYVRSLLRFAVAVTVIVTLVLLLPHPGRFKLTQLIKDHHELHAVFIALMTLPPIGAALLHGYIEKRALSEHSKQYGRIGVIFSNARERLTELIKSKQHGRARELIEALGREALEENGDWVLLHRERPLEMPHGG